MVQAKINAPWCLEISNFNGKQQRKFKYYVSTSQPDQIWASMGRKGKFFRALDKKWVKNSSFRAEIGPKKSQKAKIGRKWTKNLFSPKKRRQNLAFYSRKWAKNANFSNKQKCFLVLWNVKFQWKTTTEVQVLRKHITAWPDLRCPKNVVST